MSYLELAKALEARLQQTGIAQPVGKGGGQSATGQPSEAQGLLDHLLSLGAIFEVISGGGQDVLLWLGPAESVAPEVRAQVTTHKVAIIELLRQGHHRSRRTWGEPPAADWREHPGRTIDAEEGSGQ